MITKYGTIDYVKIENLRLIAMGFPAQGAQALIRNDIREVKRFLDSRHPGRYMVRKRHTHRRLFVDISDCRYCAAACVR